MLEMKMAQRIDSLEERMDRRFDDIHGAVRDLDRRVFRIEWRAPEQAAAE